MSKMVEKMNLKNLTPDIDMTEKCLTVPDINRPANRICRIYLFTDTADGTEKEDIQTAFIL